MMRGSPGWQRLTELVRAVGAIQSTVEHHHAGPGVRVPRQREIPDAFGGDGIVGSEAVHEDHVAPEEIQLVLAQGTYVGSRAEHALERDVARDAQRARHREGDRDVLLVLDVREPLHFLVADGFGFFR